MRHPDVTSEEIKGNEYAAAVDEALDAKKWRRLSEGAQEQSVDLPQTTVALPPGITLTFSHGYLDPEPIQVPQAAKPPQKASG